MIDRHRSCSRVLARVVAGLAGLTLASAVALAADPAPTGAAAPAKAQDAHADHTHAPGDGHDHADHDLAGHDHGAHEEVGAIPDVKQGIATGVTALVVFALVAAFLQVAVWPKISKGLDDRANKIKNEIEAAELAQQQAKSALEQYRKNLDEARAEAQRMLDQAKAQQQVIAAELKAKADIELNAMREKARKDIESAKASALNEIYAESASLATAIAGKILQREVAAQDQHRLVEQSLNELKSMARV